MWQVTEDTLVKEESDSSGGFWSLQKLIEMREMRVDGYTVGNNGNQGKCPTVHGTPTAVTTYCLEPKLLGTRLQKFCQSCLRRDSVPVSWLAKTSALPKVGHLLTLPTSSSSHTGNCLSEFVSCMINKHMKIYSTSLVVREIQIKTVIWYAAHPLEGLKF